MAKFLLMAIEDPTRFEELSASEIQAIIQRYVAWTDGLRRGGHLVDSHKLRDGEGRVLRRTGGDVVVQDGPFTETKEVVGGYWLVQARDYDEVVHLARSSPHLDFGTVVIRQIEEL